MIRGRWRRASVTVGLGLLGVVVLAASTMVVAPVQALNTYPQVNSKTLQSGKDTLEWGDRYQINVCDNHHSWRSMTLWVRTSKTSAWTKVGRTTKVNDTRRWPQQPAKCRYFAAFEWTVSKPDEGFGTITFGYGERAPEYRFRAIVRNDSGSPSPPAPAPGSPTSPRFAGNVVMPGDSVTNTGLTSFEYSLRYGRTVTIWTCTNDANYSPYVGVMYVRTGGNWRSVANGVFTERSPDCTDRMYPVKVAYTWKVDTAGVTGLTSDTGYPVVQLGTRLGQDATRYSTPSSIWGYAIVWSDSATCSEANYAGC